MHIPDSFGPSARAALADVVGRLPREDLERQVMDAMWRSMLNQLRARARLDGDIEQLSLFDDLKVSLPTAIRVVEDGVEDFVDRDLANYRQVSANELWIHQEAQRRVGIVERRMRRLTKWRDEQPATFDEEAPIGPWIFRDVTCAFGDGGWREGDPFEKAHDVAVAAGGGDQTVRWAHRSCNRSEGKG